MLRLTSITILVGTEFGAHWQLRLSATSKGHWPTALADSEGIGRKGRVLATLAKLKQVCNHPAQFVGDNSAIAGRSGKLARLPEMLDEIQAAGERALVFSQFTEMADLLQRHLQETFGPEALFLHGGVTKRRRDAMVERFEKDDDAPSVFLLSLKAGGTGLNLTRADHVFHFDRWWNPAVENQATDRAFRSGQTKSVQVHKFLCMGTLEEKVDEMIERKRSVAADVVSTGERWLPELSNDELRDLFAIDSSAVEDGYGQTPPLQIRQLLWRFPPPSRPRQAKGGIKAQSKRGAFGESWWARRWIGVLEGFNIGARLTPGRSYARRSQVLSIGEHDLESHASCGKSCLRRSSASTSSRLL